VEDANMQSFNRSMRAAAPVLLAIAAAVVPAWLGAQQRRPIAQGVLTAVKRAKVPPPSAGVSRRDIPLLTAYGELGYRAAKARARTARVPRAEQEIRSGVGRDATDVTYNAAGLNRLTAANNGFLFNPPDPQIAAGPGRVLQVVNSALQMRTLTGAVVQTMDLNTFFGAPPAQGLLFDPKLNYDAKPDPTNRRFVIVAIQQSDGPPQVGRIWLAVSRSSNPANLNAPLWCLYAQDAIINGGTADAAWPDYPGLGTSADGLLLTFNHFRFTNRTFTFATVWILNKLAAFNNAAGCPGIPFLLYQPSGTPGDPATFTLQPVQHLNDPSSFPNRSNPAYTINTHFTSAGAANYRVIRYSNSFGGGAPLAQIVDVPGNWPNSVPPDAPQSGSAILLDTGDHRVTEAAGLFNNFWGTNATGCIVGGGTPVSCLRAVRISVGDAAGNPTGVMTQQRTFGQPASFFFWSGVAVNRDEKTVLSFHYVSPTASNGFLSSWWAIKEINNTFWGSIFPFNPGTCGYTNTNRTGDYAGAETHLNKRDFWLSSERAHTIPGGGATCNWETRTILVVNGNPVFENIADR
jgi:hypothetical protein